MVDEFESLSPISPYGNYLTVNKQPALCVAALSRVCPHSSRNTARCFTNHNLQDVRPLSHALAMSEGSDILLLQMCAIPCV